MGEFAELLLFIGAAVSPLVIVGVISSIAAKIVSKMEKNARRKNHVR